MFKRKIEHWKIKFKTDCLMKLGNRRLMQEIPQHSKNTHMIGFLSQNVFC